MLERSLQQLARSRLPTTFTARSWNNDASEQMSTRGIPLIAMKVEEIQRLNQAKSSDVPSNVSSAFNGGLASILEAWNNTSSKELSPTTLAPEDRQSAARLTRPHEG
ncbi:hypothetical protein AAVH_16365 [Aphelenchoides avenae]|nr:hypothetical protein AAVH_16365 [Aphelenchus avenae]